MQWTSTISINEELKTAVDEAAAGVIDGLGAEPPDLVVAFVSSQYEGAVEAVPALVRSALGGGMLIGCTAGGVIGGGNEVEQGPAVSLTAARLPDVDIAPFFLDPAELPSPDDARDRWEEAIGIQAVSDPHFLLLPDPFSFDAASFLGGLDRAFPAASKVGGLASGGRRPGDCSLFLGGRGYRSGLAGIALSGNIDVDTVVAQGCRPIGEPMFVTGCRDNLLLELDRQSPIEVLRGLFSRLSERDREIFRHSLFLGIVMNEGRQTYEHGDFLIRNLVGIEEEAGGVTIGAGLREGMVVQFHLRDGETSARDIHAVLAGYASERSERTPVDGSLMFSCVGRGTGLYGCADHDSEMFRRHLGDVPLGGFFCNGEIGPVGGKTFLHGYTSSFGLFRSTPRA